MMNRKGAIELSASFIVVIIVSIVILSLGLAFFFNIKDTAVDYSTRINAEIEADLKSMMLSSGARVAVYPNQLTIPVGEGDAVGLGITNIYGGIKQFTIIVNVMYFADSEASGEEPPNYQRFFEMTPQATVPTINPGDQKVSIVVLKIPERSSKGQYIYTLTVTEQDASGNIITYGNVQVYVNAK